MNLMKMINRMIATSVIAVGLGALAQADILVIVHPDNASEIDPRFVKNLYQGKEARFSDGTPAIPLMLAEDDPLTLEFLDKIVEQKPVQFKRLWSQALFTGRGTPPEHLSSQTDMLNKVMSNPSYIGFIHRDNFTNDVRAVLRINLAQ